jgi:hypothetical protein
MTLEGKFVRIAYNNEGYVILGYQIANRTVGDEWIMLDVGITLMERVPDYRLKREAVSLDTPDGTLPLPSIEEYRDNESKVQGLQNRLFRRHGPSTPRLQADWRARCPCRRSGRESPYVVLAEGAHRLIDCPPERRRRAGPRGGHVRRRRAEIPSFTAAVTRPSADGGAARSTNAFLT